MHVYVCMRMQVRPNQQGRHKAPNMRACMLMRVHACVHMRVCVCDVNIIVKAHTYIHTYIHTYTHAQTHTYISIYLHTKTMRACELRLHTCTNTHIHKHISAY